MPPDKLIRIESTFIKDKSIVSNSHPNGFDFIQIDRDSIDICLHYSFQNPERYEIVMRRKGNPVVLEFANQQDYKKMTDRLEG